MHFRIRFVSFNGGYCYLSRFPEVIQEILLNPSIVVTQKWLLLKIRIILDNKIKGLVRSANEQKIIFILHRLSDKLLYTNLSPFCFLGTITVPALNMLANSKPPNLLPVIDFRAL